MRMWGLAPLRSSPLALDRRSWGPVARRTQHKRQTGCAEERYRRPWRSVVDVRNKSKSSTRLRTGRDCRRSRAMPIGSCIATRITRCCTACQRTSMNGHSEYGYGLLQTSLPMSLNCVTVHSCDLAIDAPVRPPRADLSCPPPSSHAYSCRIIHSFYFNLVDDPA